MSRPWTLTLVGAIALAACSGSGDDPTLRAAPTATVVTTAPPPDAAAVAPETSEAEIGAASAAEVSEWSIAIDVTADGFADDDIETEVRWTGAPDAVTDDGPFGTFGSCSGLRDHIGSYSVAVSGADDLDAIYVWTASRVAGAGVYDAEVRVERAGLAPLIASGTITILDDLQQGEFLAFGLDGGRVAGTFACTGSEPPAELQAGVPADGIVDAVEVLALLRDGDAERVVGLATDASVVVECRNEAGGPGDAIVRVDGDPDTGAITFFDLRNGPTGSALLRVGGVDYEFSDVAVSLDDTGTSGAFAGANADGISVDGAFNCT